MKNFINIQKILEGCLLGDGHLELAKNGKNASFRYLSSSKQHVEYIHSFFKEFCSENYQTVKRSEIYDNRTEKTYVNYSFRTKCLPIFTIQQKRFYFNKIKIVPLDIQIDEALLLMWYIGDGELEKNLGYIKLHTNSFSFEEVKFLCDKLLMFEAKPQRKTDSQFLVTIPRMKVKSFLNYIGSCPVEDYNHKWSEVPYKNKNIELNGIKYYAHIYPQIKTEFLSGKFTIYELHKKYSVPIKAIKNFLDKNEISWKPIIVRKKIIQYDLNDCYVCEWNSGQEIKYVLNYNASAISECCRGIRKQYKGYFWKFKEN